MFEAAELGHAIDDKTYEKRSKALRADLLDAQYDLIEKKNYAVVILINGVDGGGKGETVNMLNEWMDTRHIENAVFGPATTAEQALPGMSRFWRSLPAKGKIGVFFGNWYTDPIESRVHAKMKLSMLDVRLAEIRRFEKMLCDEGVLLLKYWFHLSRDAQKTRLETLEADKRTRWRVTDGDWKRFGKYHSYAKASERALRLTSTVQAPWTVVEGTDANYRTLAVTESIFESLKSRTKHHSTNKPQVLVPPVLPALDGKLILDTVKFDKRMSREKYDEKLPEAQGRIAILSRKPKFQERSVVVVFEGSDAGGKGGAIRRLTQALDARLYRTVQIAAPSEEERAHPYLWRFWRHVPAFGRFTIYDRSWYGRVLVERVEKLAREVEWLRAYGEINDFEAQLHKHGVVVVKFWLAISKDEQLARFKSREATRFKRFKITDDDWRNRKKWDEYQVAASEMIERTSTSYAPWNIIDANDKHYARVRVLDTVRKAIEKSF